jgi:hypothetical protein
MRYAGGSTRTGQPGAVRRKARGGPCGAWRRRWRGRHGFAYADGNRASSPVGDCSAGRCACSRSDSIARDHHARTRRSAPEASPGGPARRSGRPASHVVLRVRIRVGTGQTTSAWLCAKAPRMYGLCHGRAQQVCGGQTKSPPGGCPRHAAPYCRSGVGAVSFADRRPSP